MKCKYWIEMKEVCEDYCLCQGELPLSSHAVLSDVRAIAYKYLAPKGFYSVDTCKKDYEGVADRLYLFKEEIENMIKEISEHFS